jgi:protein-tyrosine phosphatase
MRAQLYTVKASGSGRLSVMARPRGGDWLADEIVALRDAGAEVLVSLLTAEEIRELDLGEEAQLCQAHDIRYLSFPIRDYSVPASEAGALAFLEELKGLLLAGKHLVIHCRAGIGRSALMAGSLLVLTGQMPQHAFELLSAARGMPVPETDEQRAWVVAFARRTPARKEER